MSGVAGYNTSVKLAGTAVVMSDEKMSTLGSSVEFQIDNQAKTLWDFATALTFTEDSCSTASATISSTNIASVDRLFGVVTFVNQPSSSVTVSGKYLPLTSVAGAHAKTVTLTKTLLDDTEFSSVGYTSRAPGLKDANIAITRWDNVSTEFLDAILNDTDVIAEVRIGGSTVSIMRGIFAVESENRSGDVTALESADVSLQLNSSSTNPPLSIR